MPLRGGALAAFSGLAGKGKLNYGILLRKKEQKEQKGFYVINMVWKIDVYFRINGNMNPILSQENLLFYLLQKLKPAAKASLCRERCQNAGFDEGEKKQEFCLCGKLLLPQAR